MLKRPRRLVKEADFAQIYKKGKRRTTQNLSLIFLETNQNTSRFGFVVSKKLASRIVDRNRIKRRLRAHISQLMETIDGGYDFVLGGKHTLLKLTEDELKSEMAVLFKKAGVKTIK